MARIHKHTTESLVSGVESLIFQLASDVREARRNGYDSDTVLITPNTLSDDGKRPLVSWVFADARLDGGVYVTTGAGATREELAAMLRKAAEEILLAPNFVDKT